MNYEKQAPAGFLINLESFEELDRRCYIHDECSLSWEFEWAYNNAVDTIKKVYGVYADIQGIYDPELSYPAVTHKYPLLMVEVLPRTRKQKDIDFDIMTLNAFLIYSMGDFYGGITEPEIVGDSVRFGIVITAKQLDEVTDEARRVYADMYD